LCFCTRTTILSSSVAMSSADRRGRRPDAVRATLCGVLGVASGCRALPRAPDSERSSSREVPRIASMTESVNDEARSASRERRFDMGGNNDTHPCQWTLHQSSELPCEVRRRPLLALRAQLLTGQSLFQNARQLFGVKAQLRANLLGPQAVAVFGEERDNSVEFRSDLARGAPVKPAGKGAGRRQNTLWSAAVRDLRSDRSSAGPRFAEELVERCVADDVEDSIRKGLCESCELSAKVRHWRARILHARARCATRSNGLLARPRSFSSSVALYRLASAPSFSFAIPAAIRIRVRQYGSAFGGDVWSALACTAPICAVCHRFPR
jgi:hypothetical protein